MDIEQFRNYCMALPGTEERMPFERFFRGRRSFLAFYAGGRMYCFFDIDRFDSCTLRCQPQQASLLRDTYEAVGPPFNLSPAGWINVGFNSDMPDAEIFKLVRQSYGIAKSLQKHKK